MSVLKIKDGNSWKSIQTIKGEPGGIINFGSLDNATLLSEGVNLDTLYQGEYYSNSSALTRTITGKPSGVSGGCMHLYCMSVGYEGGYRNYYIVQLLFLVNFKMFIRQKVGASASWGEWAEMAVKSDIPRTADIVQDVLDALDEAEGASY